MKHLGTINLLCVGGEMRMADLRLLLPRGVKLRAIAVTWDEGLPILSQSSAFDIVVMDSFDPALDSQREQIMSMLPSKTAILMLPRWMASKETLTPTTLGGRKRMAIRELDRRLP